MYWATGSGEAFVLCRWSLAVWGFDSHSRFAFVVHPSGFCRKQWLKDEVRLQDRRLIFLSVSVCRHAHFSRKRSSVPGYPTALVLMHQPE